MPANPSGSFKFDAAVMDLLACPACLGELGREPARLICARCNCAYPIVDGIPVLIAAHDRSVPG